MSLQIWLPLTNDVYNYGLSNTTVSNNGATINTEGKLGKCYKFNSNSYLRFLYPASNLQGQWSFSCWVKLTNTNTNFAIISSRKKVGAGLSVFILSGKIRFDNGTDNNTSQTQFQTVLNPNIWYHIVILQTETTRQLYINGILKETYTGNIVTSGNTAQYMLIGASASADTTPNANWLNGYLNDVRIYNHVLSLKEIEELSKGLALHYKLDDSYQESTTNLFGSIPCKNPNNTNRVVISDSGNRVTIDWTTDPGDTYWWFNLSDNISLVEGNTYTLSFQCSGLNNNAVTFAWCNLNAYTFRLKNGNNSFTFQMPSTNITKPFFDDRVRDTTLSNLQLWNWQLEEKDHATPYTPGNTTRTSTTVYDNSGYANHGIIDGVLNIVADSPRYSHAALFNGDCYITAINELNTTDSTICLWLNTSLNVGAHILDARNNESIGKQPLYSYTNGSIQSGGSNSYVTSTTGLITANTWIHLALVQSSNSLLIYKNGELFQTIACSNTPLMRLRLGARLNGINKYTGKISDFRIYTTALTAAQIKELYNTSMSIDSSGNVHTRELNEL